MTVTRRRGQATRTRPTVTRGKSDGNAKVTRAAMTAAAKPRREPRARRGVAAKLGAEPVLGERAVVSIDPVITPDFVAECKHVGAISFDKVQKVTQNPQKWVCSDCKTSERVWVCMTCGNIGCGREVEAHAKHHFESRRGKHRHPICLEIATRYCWCYVCDGYVLTDSVHDDLKQTRRSLKESQSLVVSASKTRSGRVIHPRYKVRNPMPSDDGLREQDNMSTAEAHLRRKLLWKTFMGWRAQSEPAANSPARWTRRSAKRTRGRHSPPPVETIAENTPHTPRTPLSPSGSVLANVFSGIRGIVTLGRRLSGAVGAALGSAPGHGDITDDGSDDTEMEDYETADSTGNISMSPASPLTLNDSGLTSGSDSEIVFKKPHSTVAARRRQGKGGNLRVKTEDDRAGGSRATGTGGRTASSARVARPLVPLSTPRRSVGVTGLRNLGNTCYMNSVIQVLSHTRAFRDIFLNQGPELSCTLNIAESVSLSKTPSKVRGYGVPPPTCFRDEFGLVMESLFHGKGAVVSPNRFLSILWKAVPHFRGHLQQDAHEFLLRLLEYLDHNFPPSAIDVLPEPSDSDDVSSDGTETAAIKAEPERQSGRRGGTRTSARGRGRGRSASPLPSSLTDTELEDTEVIEEELAIYDDPSEEEIVLNSFYKGKGKGKGKGQGKGQEQAREEARERAKAALVKRKARAKGRPVRRRTSTSSPVICRNREPQQQPISPLFRGTLVSELQCQTCHATSVTSEPFMDVSLDIPTPSGGHSIGRRRRLSLDDGEEENVATVLDCLTAFTKPELLEDLMFCSRCRKKQVMSKRMSFCETPNILCLHLKRTQWTARTRAKITTPVRPVISGLDLSPFTDARSLDDDAGKQGNGKGKKKRKRCTQHENESLLYDLTGIVEHHGAQWSSGHYTARCRSVQDIGNWHQFNDVNVKVSSREDVEACQPFILVYERRENASDEPPLKRALYTQAQVTDVSADQKTGIGQIGMYEVNARRHKRRAAVTTAAASQPRATRSRRKKV